MTASTEAGFRPVTFTTSRQLDFFSSNELTKQTGHGPEEWPHVIVKECIDNALDSSEENRRQPNIVVTVSNDYRLTISDDAGGIEPQHIASVLDFATRTSSRERYIGPTRGAQGNALKTLIGFAYIWQTELIIVSRGFRHSIRVDVDPVAEVPRVHHEQTAAAETDGTVLQISCGDEFDTSEIMTLCETFAMCNPHLNLTVNLADHQQTFRASDPTWNRWTPDKRGSAHWYSVDELSRLVAGYLSQNRDTLVSDFLTAFDGLSRSAKRTSVLTACGLHRASLDSLLAGDQLDADRVSDLLKAMQDATKLVKPQQLGVIGKSHLTRYLGPNAVYRKIADVDEAGLPYVFELAFVIDDEQPLRQVLAGVNCSAGIRFPFSQIIEFGEVDQNDPVTVFAHLSSPKVSYADRGKSQVLLHCTKQADSDGNACNLRGPTAQKICELYKKASEPFVKAKRRMSREAAKGERLLHRLCRDNPKPTFKDVAGPMIRDAYPVLSSDGEFYVTARNLFYECREELKNTCGSVPTQDYFNGLVRAAADPNWLVAFEPRGNFVEPHTGLTVPLGTIKVKEYLRGIPPHRFGAVLFIEKEGFEPLLRHAKFAERHDVAILGCKGQSVEAARELIDTLCGEGDRPLIVVHDFDRAGFDILGAITRDSDIYQFKYDIQPIDAGLRLADAERFGIVDRAETLPLRVKNRSGKTGKNRQVLHRPLPNLTDAENEFLMSGKRIELNAFRPQQLLQWLAEKVEEAGVRKVIPPADILKQRHREEEQSRIRAELMRDIEEQVSDQMTGYQPPNQLPRQVEAVFRDSPDLNWEAAILSIHQKASE